VRQLIIARIINFTWWTPLNSGEIARYCSYNKLYLVNTTSREIARYCLSVPLNSGEAARYVSVLNFTWWMPLKSDDRVQYLLNTWPCLRPVFWNLRPQERVTVHISGLNLDCLHCNYSKRRCSLYIHRYLCVCCVVLSCSISWFCTTLATWATCDSQWVYICILWRQSCVVVVAARWPRSTKLTYVWPG